MKGIKKGRRAVSVLAIVFVVALVASCSAAPSPSLKSVAPSAPEQQPAATDSARGSAGIAPSASAPQAAGTAAESKAPSWDRMIIRTATVALIVRDVEAAISSVRDLAGTAGGFIAQSSTRYDGEFQVATVTIQVPADRFDGTMEALRRQAVKVESENGSTQDVTEEYSDLDAQVRNLQATEASLQRLMDKVTRMEDILALQRELTNVRGEIEKRQGRMKFLTRRADMASITVSLRPEGLASPAPQGQWEPLRAAQDAWARSLVFLTAASAIVVALVVFFWWLGPIALLAAYLWRRRRVVHRPGAST